MKKLYFSLFCILTLHFCYGQIQIGNDLNGMLTDDDFGYSVSISDDGQRVAIGAPGDIIGQEAGYVQVYQRSGSGWIQLGNTIEGKLPYNNAGGRLALSGNGQRIILGAIYNNNGQQSGSVIIYEFNGSDWVQVGSGLGAISNLRSVGQSVAISENGNVIAYTTTIITSISEITGQVEVFEWNGSAWNKRGNTFNPTQTFDLYGYAIDLSADGSRLAIGAGNGLLPTTGFSGGFAQVFQFQNGQWIQVGSNILSKYDLGSFGSDVSLSGNGNRIIVSGPSTVDNLTFTGTVRAFDFNGSDWQLVGNELIGGASFDNFGDGIKLSKDGTSFIYASTKDGDNRGCAAVYSLKNNIWEMQLDKVCGDFDRDQFGYSVDISADGKTTITGARVNDFDGIRSGYARVWDYKINTSSHNLINQQLLLYPNPALDRIQVQWPDTQISSAKIYNIQGQLILETEVESNDAIDIQVLDSGIYFLECNDGNNRYFSKFVKGKI